MRRMTTARQVLMSGRWVTVADFPKPEAGSVSHFNHHQMQAHFWYRAQSLGMYARVEATLGGAGRADLLISRDLLARVPLAVVEVKERLSSVHGMYVGVNQTRRYLSWLRKRLGYSPRAYLVAPEVPAWLLADSRFRDAPTGVVVLGAADLHAELATLPELSVTPKRGARPVLEMAS